MARIPVWRRYLRLFGPDVRADVQEELGFHLEAKTSELIAQGVSPDEARRQATRQFGDWSEVSTLCRRIGEEQSRKMQFTSRASEWAYDIRHAIRSLSRAPKFTLLAALTLAAGIAGAASLFSVVDGWILHAVRFAHPHQLVYIQGLDTRRGRELRVSIADYQDLRDRSRQMQSLAAWTANSYTLSLSDGAERIAGARVSANFFATLGVEPVLGRAFLAAESLRGSHYVAIVSHGFWKTRLGGDRSAVGRRLELDGQPYTIVGVLPERFQFPLAGRANIWTPLAPTAEEQSARQDRFLQLIGRMNAGVIIAQARQELSSIAAQLAAVYPKTNLEIGTASVSLSDEIGRHTGEQLILVVFAVTVGLLLMACSNVANLLLVRSLGRKRQASIQLSLGATRGRLVRQALVETLAVFLLSAVLGAAAGQWFTNLITAFIPYENRGYLPDYGQASLSANVVLFVLAIALLTGLTFGLAPALENARSNVVAALRESGSALSQSPKARRLRLAFVTSQIILATVLLSATAILVQGFRATWAGPMGFDSSGVLTFMLSLDERQYPDPSKRFTFFDTVADAVSVPQSSAKPALARFVPFGNDSGGTAFQLTGQEPADPRHLPRAGFNMVSSEFFAALRIPVIAGRTFAPHDSPDAPLVAVVNDAFVAQYLRGGRPVGQPLRLSTMENRTAEIVGVVAEIRQDSDPRPGYPQIYVPFAQSPSAQAFVILRAPTGTDANEMLPEIRRRVAAIDARQPVFDAKTMDDRIYESLSPYRIISGMLVWFGFLALILAAVGVYGVVAYSVSQRTREIGIRAALGAGRAQLLRLFLAQGATILTAGLLPGLLGGVAAGIGLRKLIPEGLPGSLTPPLVFTAAIVASVVLVATVFPARRAASVVPLAAIRYE